MKGTRKGLLIDETIYHESLTSNLGPGWAIKTGGGAHESAKKPQAFPYSYEIQI